MKNKLLCVSITFCVFLILNGNVTASLQDGLVAFYPLNGNANDASGNNHNGNNSGAKPTNDRFGNARGALQFDGTNYITVPDFSSLDLSNALTFTAWVAPTAFNGSSPNTTTIAGVVSKPYSATSTGYRLGFTGDRVCPGFLASDGIIFGVPEDNDEVIGVWIHIAVTMINRDYIKLYVNGSLVSEGSGDGSSYLQGANPLFIGTEGITGNGDRAFRGSVSDVRIYNRALSSAEIASLAADHIPPAVVTAPQTQIASAGSQVRFTVTVTGSGSLSYQWMRNGFVISGATSQTYTLPNAQTADNGSYSVTVSNAYGAVTSAGAPLYVFSPATGTPPNTPTMVSTTQALSTAQTSKPRVPSSTQLLSFGSNALVDPSKMTVVLTHGWNADPKVWAQPMANALVAYINAHPTEYPGGQPNILAWDWHENAFISPAYDPVTSAARTPSEGTSLGRALMDTLGPTYNKPIHFIGHSLGTLVNCVAADYIHGDHRPASDTRSSSERYDPSKTHSTLLDEAELVGAIPSVPAVLFDLLVVPPELGGGVASINGIIQTIRNSCSKVIPDRSAWIDNYLSEVGLVQSSAANVLLYGNPPTGGIQSAHGYAYRWYQKTVVNPAGSIMGMTWSFERNTLVPSQPARPENTYFLQNAVSGSADLGLTQIAQPSALLFTSGQLILFGSAAAYSALHAESALASVPITVIQYSGNVGTSIIQSFTIPNGSPTYLGTSGSTPAYFTTSSQTVPTQANYNFQIGIQPSASQLQAQTRRRAQKTASDVSANAVYTIVPIHVPNEAVGVSFEYQMTGAADDDFMTMGIGTGNSYTMEGEYVNSGEWNVTPMIQTSSYHGQDTQLVFAMNGSNGLPAGILNIRNIQFYTPPRPQLNLTLSGQQATLGWSLSAPGWTLQVSSSLSDPNSWQTANGTASDTNFQHTMTLNVGLTSQFYRLIK